MTPSQHYGYADLHMHTTASDGASPVRDLLNDITRHKPHLNVIAITDHDTLDAALWAYEQKQRYPFDIVPGMEVSSRAGHILALWITTPIPANMDLMDTVTAIREAGGISVLAHPFHVHMGIVWQNARRYLREPEVLLQAGIDAIEVHNAGVVTPISNWLSRCLAQRLNLAMLGNSDAHTPGAVGSGVTRFIGRSSDDLRRAIEQNQTIAEGKPWPWKEYLRYLQHMSTYGEINSSANMNSSHQTSH